MTVYKCYKTLKSNAVFIEQCNKHFQVRNNYNNKISIPLDTRHILYSNFSEKKNTKKINMITFYILPEYNRNKEFNSNNNK